MTRPHNQFRYVSKHLAALVGAWLLSACAAGPTRTDPDAFVVLSEGRVAPSAVQAFADCLLDAFGTAHSMLTNVTSRQSRRSDSYRVETLAGGRLLVVSVDAFDDGRVVLNEAKAARFVDTSGEREAFKQCLGKNAATK